MPRNGLFAQFGSWELSETTYSLPAVYIVFERMSLPRWRVSWLPTRLCANAAAS